MGTWTDLGVVRIEDPLFSIDGRFLFFHEGEEYFVLNDQGKVLARKRLAFHVQYPKWIEDSKGRQLLCFYTEKYILKVLKTDLDTAWETGEAVSAFQLSPNSRLVGYTTFGKDGALVIRRADGIELGQIGKNSLSPNFTSWTLFNSGTVVAFTGEPSPRLMLWRPGQVPKLLVVLPVLKYREASSPSQVGESNDETIDISYGATSEEVKNFPQPTLRLDIRAKKAWWTKNAPKVQPPLQWNPKAAP